MISPSVGARRELSGPVFHCRSEISTSRGLSGLQAATCPRHSPAHISVHKSLKHNQNCHSMFMRTERERDLASDRTSALGFDPPRQLSHVDGPWEFCTSPRLRMRTRQRAGRRIKRVPRRVVDVVYHYDLTASLRNKFTALCPDTGHGGQGPGRGSTGRAAAGPSAHRPRAGPQQLSVPHGR